jgi:tetratricopeptide (TPR) repeat protein
VVLRKELDRNPDDPGLYERLAQFLDQNRLGEQQEQVYQKAIQKFDGTSWYHKLARFYLRHDRNADFNRLSEQVIRTFSGTELESYFVDVVRSGDFYVQLNEFAHKRFPHDLTFVRNLLGSKGVSAAEHDALLREHWWETEDLRDRFFEYLSRTGKLDAELAALRRGEASEQRGDWNTIARANPVATRFIGEAEFWRSHFEQGAPAMGALAAQLPSDVELGRRASAVYRSLAAFDPRDTETAVAIEENLYKANPGDRETLARIGDILADRELFTRAAPYWDRMTTIRPGEAQAYLDPATIYWDYYDFSGALGKFDEGRKKLGSPALYSYQVGAIYENQSDYAAAIREYVKGAISGEGSRSRERLLQLAARRPKLRQQLDDALAPLTAGDHPDLNAVQLDIAVLEAENRPKDIEGLLTRLANGSSSLEALEWIEQTARAKSLPALERIALERQAAVTTDPTRKIELHYAVVQLLERAKDETGAQSVVEAVYRENPKLLGVVRFTTDFYWRNKQSQRALDVLLQAANSAYPELRDQFRFEAARKATEAGEYALARKTLAQLLVQSPRNEQYVAAMAETFGRAGDDNGLKDFYLRTLDQYRNAQLPLDERNRQVAALRRGLIPALTRLKDYPGAVSQYIEIINKYPDDADLTSEAALYALRYGRQQQLLTYYADAMKQSPRDSHWPIVLARTQAQLEDYSAAIETYAAALRIRNDRVDLHTARADLLERVMRLDDAAAEYQKLYDLNYHDPQWMLKVATIRARQGRSADVIAALRLALIEGRPEKSSNYFEVAQQLANWNMLNEARDFAQKGVDLAGADLLARSENHSGAELYTRILTRLRRQSEAFARLKQAVADTDSFTASLGVAVTQVEKNGLSSLTNSQIQQAALQVRREAAKTGMQIAMRATGETVATYFTPEQKVAFASELQKNAAGSNDDQLALWFITCARSAGLADLEAQWLEQVMMASPITNGPNYERRLIELQSQRLKYAQLGKSLERYANVVNRMMRDGILNDAANAYHAGGLYDAELDVLSEMVLQTRGHGDDRYLRLLLARRPQQLVQLARDGDAAAQIAVQRGPLQRALETVRARGMKEEPVWTSAYVGLTGLYFGDRDPAIGSSFTTALGGGTIGERIGKPVDRKQQLAGKPWFYYGSRYGEWLGLSNDEDAENYLPAMLELSPGTATSYATLADYYDRAKKFDRALLEYDHTLELAPARADIHDRIALLYWKQNKRVDAIAHWKQALESLDGQVNSKGLADDFWPTLAQVLQHLGDRGVLSDVRPQADTVLRAYFRFNGTYNADGLLRAAFLASGNPQAGVAWLLDLSQVAPDPVAMVTLLANARWIPLTAREPIYTHLIEQLRSREQNTQALAQDYAASDLRRWQVQYSRFLLDTKQYDRALAIIDSLPKQATPAADELEIRYRVAIAQNAFNALIDHYRAAPGLAPPLETLRTVTQSLRNARLVAPARKLQEFVYQQEIANHQLTATNLLGLAQIRLEQNDLPGAMELLKRATLVVGAPYENLDNAASVLARNGHHAEAADFLSQLVKAQPWDFTTKVKLAKEQIAAQHDEAAARADAAVVARSQSASFTTRTDAATLASAQRQLGSIELDLLASGKADVKAADQPFFYAARMVAAGKGNTTDRALLLANALKDYPERTDARPLLLSALAAQGKFQLAVSAGEPLLRTGYFDRGRGPLPPLQDSRVRGPRPTQADAEEVAALEGKYDDSTDYASTDASTDNSDAISTDAADAATRTPLEPEVTDASLRDRATQSSDLARSYAALEDWQSAMLYYRTALAYLTQHSSAPVDRATQTSPRENAGSTSTYKARRASLYRSIHLIQANIERESINRSREPVIHSDLDQPNVVAPRLVSRAQAPPKTSPKSPAKPSTPKKGAAL